MIHLSFLRILVIIILFATVADGGQLPPLNAQAGQSQEKQKSTESKDPEEKMPAFRVLVVVIFDEYCKQACSSVRQYLSELSKDYPIKLVELDVSEKTYKDAEKTAKALGIKWFLYDSEEWIPIVGVFNARRKCVKELRGRKLKEVYKAAIEKALASNGQSIDK